MRQVGDRLIPVGVTSGRVHALSPEEAAQAEVPAEGTGSRRSRRRQQQPPNGNFEQFMGMGGPELEEVGFVLSIHINMPNAYDLQLMIMEAMRLSLIDHEEQQRKEAEEKKKKAIEASNGTATEDSASAGPGPGPSTLEARSNPPATALNLPSPSPSGSSLSVNRNPSRSRSPSPNPLQALKDTASGWRRRTSSPPPFTTLSAALSTVSTASAVINGSGPEPSSPSAPPTQSDTPAETSGGDGDNTIPTITVAGSGPPNESTASEEMEIPVRPPSNHQESFTSMLSTSSSVGGVDAYDNLPSSPDSFAAHEPLLVSPLESGEAPATPKNPTATATNGDHPADYFG
jgi:hypothetical protein